MINFLVKRKGLLIFILYVTPLCVFLQSLTFATTNIYGASYILLSAFLLIRSGFHKKNIPFLLIFFFLIMLFSMAMSAEWLAVMQSSLLMLYLYSKPSQDLYGIEKLSVIILFLGLLCALACIFELIAFPLYSSIIQSVFKPEESHVIITLFYGGGMCGIMPQTSHAAGCILNAFYVLVVLKGNTIPKIWKILLSLLLIIGLFLTAKRTHLFFGLSIWIFSFIITSSSRKRIKNMLVVISIAALSIPAIVSIAPKLGEDNVVSEILFSFQHISKDKEDVMHGRDYLYEQAWEKIKESPLTGHGWGYFKNTVDYHGGSTDVHNVYLQLWAECGIFMLLLFIIVLLTLIFKTIRLAKFYEKFGKNKSIVNLLKFSFCIQGFFIIYCFTGNCLYNIDFFSMYILAVSIMLAVRRQKKMIYV